MPCNITESILQGTTRHVLNFSDYDLPYLTVKVSCCRIVLTLFASQVLCKEEIFAEFESLLAQLLRHSASSVEQRTALTLLLPREKRKKMSVRWQREKLS